MFLPYTTPAILSEKSGNNALSYDERSSRSLTIPSGIIGDISDVKIGKVIVFEEFEDGILRSCVWLEHFVRLQKSSIPITIFDNHNHALAFWYEAFLDGKIQKQTTLIHIDEHSDLWDNPHDIHIVTDPDFLGWTRTEQDAHIYEFTNMYCNVGNYIQPAIRDGLIGTMIRIENEYQLDAYVNYQVHGNTILNIDLDFFSPEMDFISFDKKIKMIKNIIPYVECITIATSPYFIEPWIALSVLPHLFPNL